MTAGILMHGIRAVQATAFLEHRAKRGARTLRSHQDYIDVFRRNNTRAVAPADGKAMTVVEGLARCEMRFDCWPCGNLTSIAQQHAKNGSALSGLLNREQRLAGYPTIGNSLLEGLSFTLTHDDIESVIAQVASLTRTLNTIANHSYRFVLQHFACLLQ